jgi:hypothetical protein
MKGLGYCGNCPHLSPKEWEQDQIKGDIQDWGKREGHYCMKYHKYVFHHGHHPEIIRLSECKLPTLTCQECGKEFTVDAIRALYIGKEVPTKLKGICAECWQLKWVDGLCEHLEKGGK